MVSLFSLIHSRGRWLVLLLWCYTVVCPTAGNDGVLKKFHLLVNTTQGTRFVDFYNAYITTGYNDDDGTKALMWPNQLYDLGEFVSAIDMDDPPYKICIEARNSEGVLIGVCFETTGADMTSLESWVTTERVRFAYPYGAGRIGGFDVTARIQNFDLSMTSVDDFSELWFTIENNKGSNTFIVSPSLSTSLSYTGDFSTGLCYSFTRLLDRLHQFNSNQMTPLSCLQACASSLDLYTHIAIEYFPSNGTFNCHCTNVANGASDLPAFCETLCTGDPSTHMCGGTVAGFFSVYSGSLTVDNLQESTGGALKCNISLVNTPVLEYHVNFSQVINEAFLFLEAFSVTALDIDGNTIQYTYGYTRDKNATNCTYIPSDTEPITGNGTLYDIEVRPMRLLCLYFIGTANDLNILLYSPNDGEYVAADFVLLYGLYDISPTTSSVATATTSSIDATSTISITSVSPSMTSSDMCRTTVTATSTVTETISTTVSVISTERSPASSVCYKPYSCSASSKEDDSPSEELNQKVKEIVANLTVPEKSLSSYKRKYTSAPDARASSAVIGTIGVLFLVSVIGSIVLLDSPRLAMEFVKLGKNFRIARKTIHDLYVKRETSMPVSKISPEELPSVLSVYDSCDLDMKDLSYDGEAKDTPL